MKHYCGDCKYLDSGEIELQGGGTIWIDFCELRKRVVSPNDLACVFFENASLDESEDDKK